MSDAEPAASSSAARAGIEALTERLRAAKLPIGPSEQLDATRLLLRLGQTGRGPADPAELKPALRPVFCKRVEDKVVFDAEFDAWLESFRPKPALPPTTTPTNQKPWLRWVVWLMLAAALVALVRRCSTPEEQRVVEPKPIVDGGAPDTTRNAGAIPEAGVKAEPEAQPPPTPQVEDYVPVQRVNRALRPFWVFLGLGLALLPLAFIRVPAAVLARRRSRSGRLVYLDARRVEAEALKLVPPLHTESAARLSRHIRGQASDPRRLSRRPALDMRRTIEATLRHLGVPTLRYRHALLRPSYLMLIDGEIDSDPRARLLYEWAKRLMREGWDVEIRAFRSAQGSGDEAPRSYRIENAGWSEARAVEMPLDHLEDPGGPALAGALRRGVPGRRAGSAAPVGGAGALQALA